MRSIFVSERDSAFGQIIRGQLDSDLVADRYFDEIFAHLARNVRQNFSAISQAHTIHGGRQDLDHHTLDFYDIFLLQNPALHSCYCRPDKA